jgi:hypothetical protein
MFLPLCSSVFSPKYIFIVHDPLLHALPTTCIASAVAQGFVTNTFVAHQLGHQFLSTCKKPQGKVKPNEIRNFRSGSVGKALAVELAK